MGSSMDLRRGRVAQVEADLGPGHLRGQKIRRLDHRGLERVARTWQVARRRAHAAERAARVRAVARRRGGRRREREGPPGIAPAQRHERARRARDHRGLRAPRGRAARLVGARGRRLGLVDRRLAELGREERAREAQQRGRLGVVGRRENDAAADGLRAPEAHERAAIDLGGQQTAQVALLAAHLPAHDERRREGEDRDDRQPSRRAACRPANHRVPVSFSRTARRRENRAREYAARVRYPRWLVLATVVSCAHPSSLPAGSPPAGSPPTGSPPAGSPPSGSSAAAAPTGLPPSVPASDFGRLVDAYFDAMLAYAPSSATAVGLHAHDRALEDLSRARIEARIAEVRGFVARLEALPAAGLSTDEAVDRAFLTSQARAELFDLVTLESWRRNPMVYARLPGEAVDGLMKRAFAPAAERLRSVVARLRLVPALYAAARANLENPAPEHTLLALRMAKGSVAFFESATRTWARSATGDAALLAEFDRRQRRRARRDARLRRLARARSHAALARRLRPRRREVPRAPAPAGDGRDAAARAAGQGRGPPRAGPRCVHRDRSQDRARTEARRGHADAHGRAPDGRRPHPVGGARPRGGAPVRHRAQPRDLPVRAAAHREGDAALRARRRLRVDGHARPVRGAPASTPTTTSRPSSPTGRPSTATSTCACSTATRRR